MFLLACLREGRRLCFGAGGGSAVLAVLIPFALEWWLWFGGWATNLDATAEGERAVAVRQLRCIARAQCGRCCAVWGGVGLG